MILYLIADKECILNLDKEKILNMGGRRLRQTRKSEERRRDREEDLRSENKRLRKQIGQLQKQLGRLTHREIEVQEIREEYEAHQRETQVIADKPQCPLCGSYEVSIMEKLMNDTDYFVCAGCKGRGKYR